MSAMGFACALLAAALIPASSPQGAPEPGTIKEVRQGYQISLPPLGVIPVAKSLPVPVNEGMTPRDSSTFRPVATGLKRKEAVTRISGYAYCGSSVKSAQRCIDAGKLTLYFPAGVRTLAGHNYLGWYWMDDLPVGRKVVIKSGRLAGTYRVYAHGWAKRGSQGGRFPSAGRGASVALQTCTSNGTGFSFLRHIGS